ncbi:MAG: hypothetical protein JKY10_04650 [Cohaesibacteraceae bacterium]|nr:hypothetical protein [Cohaesibacteraceae bacterium]
MIVRNSVADEIHEKFVDGSIQWAGEVGPGWLYVSGVFVEPEPTIDDVKAECLRRRKVLMGLTASSSTKDLDYKRSLGVEEAVALQDIRLEGGTWSSEQTARALILRQTRSALKLTLDKSNALQTMNPIPSNFQEDTWWS